MMNSVNRRYTSKIKWADVVKAREIESKLLRVGAALVVRVNSANRAEIMSGCHRVELIHAEFVRALYDRQPIKRDGSHDCATSAAH